MFSAFNHLFFFFDNFTWTSVFHLFSIVCLLIIIQNISFSYNFTYIFWVLNDVPSCMVKWGNFTTILCMMLLDTFCYVCRYLFSGLFLSGSIDTIFSHSVCLGFIISFWFKSSFILLSFSVVFFVPLVSWSV